MKKRFFKKLTAFVIMVCLSVIPAASFACMTPAKAASAKLSVSRFTLVKGGNKTLKVKGGKATAWNTSDKKVATVSSSGKVKAEGTGTCTISATVGSKTLTAKLAVVPSQKDVTKKILAMKDKYPEGTSWTSKNTYTFKNLGGKSMPSSECQAFAFMMSDEAYGNLPAYVSYDFGQIKAGDVIFLLAGCKLSDGTTTTASHAVCVQSVDYDKNEIIVCEGNYGGKVHWDAKLYISEIATYAGQVIITRYLHSGTAGYLKKPAAEKITSNKKESDGYYYVRWKKFDKACEGYQVLISSKKDMPWKETAVYYLGKNYNYVQTDWGGTTYYFKVRAFNFDKGKITYGKWSKVKKVSM